MQKAKKFFAATLVFVVILSTHAAAASGSTTVYITRTGGKYHSYGCGYLSRSCIEISLYDAVNRGYTPCSRCNPPILTYDEPEQPAEEVVEEEPTWYQTAPVGEVAAMEAYRNALKQTAESGAWSGSGKEEAEASKPEVAEPEAAPAIVIEPDPKEAQEDGYVYTSQVGTVFHKIDCPKLPDYQRQKFSIEEALDNGYLPCDVCDPLSGADFEDKQSWKIDAEIFIWLLVIASLISFNIVPRYLKSKKQKTE